MLLYFGTKAMRRLAAVATHHVENLGYDDIVARERRPLYYHECRLCGRWAERMDSIEHADGCELVYVSHLLLQDARS